ncbi:MAG: AAA family ATPase [Clostridia bacterium]|nr:AAA family ATPase [Clostridia bacterium]
MSAAEFYGLSYLPFSGDTDIVNGRFDSYDLSQAIAVTDITARENGMGLLTGPSGTGISFSAYCASQKLDPSQHTIRYYPICNITPRDFYKGLCRVTGTVPKEKGREAMFSAIRERALTFKSQGHPFFLFLDCAQNIPNVILEDIPTLLTGNYGIGRVMGIMLCGTDELRTRIRSTCVSSLYQMICSRYSFHGLKSEECSKYVIQSITAAGGSRDIVSQDVLNALHATSYMGNFRTLRNLMRDAFRIGAQEKREVIDMEVLRSAAAHLTF